MDRGRPGPDRQHPRVAVDAFVRVLGAPDGREFVFRVRDLSSGGMFLYTRVGHMYPFKQGTPLSIVLYDFDHAVELKATIVRVVEPGSPEAERFPAGFGVRIIELDETNRQRLDSLIARAQRGDPLY